MSTSTFVIGGRRWKRYPFYKDSGIAWLGEIPAHWQTSTVKRAFSVRLGKMLQPLQADTRETLGPYLRAANILWNGVDVNDVREMWFSPRDKAEYALERDDLLVSEGGDVGRSAIWRSELNPCYIQNAINRVRSRGVSSTHFLYYWMYTLKAGGYIDMLCNKATIAHFTAEKVGPTQFAAPPPDEQRAIADFLDRETGRIEALLAKKQRLIELLQEKRSALISQAVTRGLDPNAPLRESGVEWLGKVAAHWRVVPLGRVARLQRGHDLPTGDRQPGQVPIVSSSGVSDYHSVAKAAGPGVVTGRYGTIGEVFYIETDYWPLNTTLYVVDFNSNHPCYIFYLLKLLPFEAFSGKSAVPGVDRNDLHPLLVCRPPSSEQRAIAAHLDRQTAKIDALIAKVRESIERWREYRAALIAAAVTGKIDVRESSCSPSSCLSSSSSPSSSDSSSSPSSSS